MKSRTLKFAVGVVLLAELATPVSSVAQTSYKLIDIGTLGGPSAHGPGNGAGSQLINNAGVVAGSADTSIPCNGANCPIAHGFKWENGALTDLGALPGGSFSGASSINARGWIAGGSKTGQIDPFNPACGFQPFCPQFHGVFSIDDELITKVSTLSLHDSLTPH